MKEFRLQPKILFGEDSLDYLKTLEYKKVMIVTDEVMTQLKLTDFVTNSLSSTTEIKIFDKVEPNPSMTTIENGLKDFIDFEPQCIIALGGGSPIDACKAILYFSYELYKKLKVNKRIFFIAIPTTSGTGSEVTSYSVVTKDESGKLVKICKPTFKELICSIPQVCENTFESILAPSREAIHKGREVRDKPLVTSLSGKSDPW